MTDQEAKSRAKQVVGKCAFSAFATVDKNGCPQLRAMMQVAVDDDLTAYYITHRQSTKCGQIAANPCVSSLWADVVAPISDATGGDATAGDIALISGRRVVCSRIRCTSARNAWVSASS